MSRAEFEHGLEEVHGGLLSLGALASRAVEQAIGAFLDGDRAAAERVVDADVDRDRLACDIERRVLDVVARQSPVARDLRLLHVCLLGEYKLGRVGHLASDIARSTFRVPPDAVDLAIGDLLREMALRACSLLDRALHALAVWDAALGRRLADEDVAIDELFSAVLLRVAEIGSASLAVRRGAVEAALVARHLERVGDHGVDLGARVGFLVSGSFPDRAPRRIA